MQKTLIQYFEWYLPADSDHWNRAAADAENLARLGINGIWLPPAYKGQGGVEDVGYGVYDLYDLGEFHQWDTVPTKYGTKNEYLAAVKALQAQGIQVYADAVLNHRMGADYLENITVNRCKSTDRTKKCRKNETILAHTGFDFPGRKGKYSAFRWNHTHFDGVDWDERTKKNAIWQLKGEQWEGPVDLENGCYDYLMGADLDMDNQEVLRELDAWGEWYLEFTGVDGFRLDAIKHINFNFFTRWLTRLRRLTGRELFAVGEYWSGDLKKLMEYLDTCGECMTLFDVPLHYKLFAASKSGPEFDLRTIFEDTLVQERPRCAVTFVDNHDSQPGQALQSWVEDWFRPQAYALILLRKDGIPCAFYGDLKGIPHDGIAPLPCLEKLLLARQRYAVGPQVDYFDFPNTVGWTRENMAVVISNSEAGWKRMKLGSPGKVYVDLLGNRTEEITIDETGWADFTVAKKSVSVWVPKE